MLAPSEDLNLNLSGLRVNTPLVTATVTGPPTAQMAVRLYPTDVATPDFTGLWGPFLPGFSVDLGTGDGPRYLWVGFRGMDSQGNPGPELWRYVVLVLDTTPPVLSITEPVGTTTSQPIIQVRGTADEALRFVDYDLANANGSLFDQKGTLLEKTYDPETFEVTGCAFQLIDVDLATGSNAITVRATDLAGNAALPDTRLHTRFGGRSHRAADYPPLAGERDGNRKRFL